MTNKEAMKQMVKVFGFDSVMEMVETVRDEIREEEKKYQRIISPYEYSSTGRQGDREKIVYPSWVEETYNKILSQTGIGCHTYGSGGSRGLKITYPSFAKYVIYTCNDNGITLSNILEVLMAAPAWCNGYGITRSRMELVFHILVLHRENTGAVKEELKKLLNKYDPVALKVFANADDAYRHTLSYDAKMIAFAEKKVCENIAEAKPRFEVVA